MEAKIKATGEIVHVGDYNTIHHDPMYKNERTGPWRLEELDFTETPDYWARLEHQYAGMAMQSYVSNNVYLREIREMCKEPQEMRDLIADLSILLAATLVQKLKEKEERK